jgi:hypothetical protein
METERIYADDWLKSEAPAHYSREVIVILAGSGAARNLTSGMVLAKVTKGTASAAAQAGNTGNGTMGAITVGAAAKPGVYKLEIIEPATDAGKFHVFDPDGIFVGQGTVAVAFSAGGLGFTLADGGTDFVSGDGFDITVAAGSGKWVQYNEDGTTGTEDAAGILLHDASAADAVDGEGVAIVRDAIVSDNGLVWPSTADANEKAAAVEQLTALGILVREGA